MDFVQEGFFDGLDGAALAERQELLDWLVAEGFSDDQLRRAHRRGLLVFLAAEREVGGEPKYTAAEVAERSGADPELLAKLRRAHGLPLPEADAIELTDVDLASARTSTQFVELGLTEEQMVATTRVLGRSLATAWSRAPGSWPIARSVWPTISPWTMLRRCWLSICKIIGPTSGRVAWTDAA